MTHATSMFFSKIPVSTAFIYLFCQGQVEAACTEDITVPLSTHIIPNSLKYFTGRFIDVWVSKHLTDILNGSFSETFKNGTTNSYVLYKNGQGFMSSAQLTLENSGIINVNVDGTNMTGLIFPVYISVPVLGYYNCYPNVKGPGISTITVRAESLQNAATFESVYEAKATFRHLQELGILINDGVDYTDTPPV
ncbi:uncharacterized protein LOC124357495 isoform X2 [Homalodisca vitripennis]|nr:uncharacterized protein LOC124357495 isoform X2 [Homalodisca vitripennis]KAG8248941.1 hypothetical protein J6590_030968 [Homalodisca vitripennis]